MKKFVLSTLCASLAFALNVKAAPVSGINQANFDKSVRAQDDLFRAVNGHWLKSFEIPADKSNYG
ncbi:hypothetical protein NL352_30325, partial [Klebsiella pneumoniae]|nr:hypothetical protein [Klebsiella pneumoniae]